MIFDKVWKNHKGYIEKYTLAIEKSINLTSVEFILPNVGKHNLRNVLKDATMQLKNVELIIEQIIELDYGTARIASMETLQGEYQVLIEDCNKLLR